jgi:hypothetical protein
MLTEIPGDLTSLRRVNDDLQIALSAITNISKEPDLRERASADEVVLINEILIDMTTLMISINHQLLSLPPAIEASLAIDEVKTKEHVKKIVKSTENEFVRIRTKLTQIVHLLRPY